MGRKKSTDRYTEYRHGIIREEIKNGLTDLMQTLVNIGALVKSDDITDTSIYNIVLTNPYNDKAGRLFIVWNPVTLYLHVFDGGRNEVLWNSTFTSLNGEMTRALSNIREYVVQVVADYNKQQENKKMDMKYTVKEDLIEDMFRYFERLSAKIREQSAKGRFGRVQYLFHTPPLRRVVEILDPECLLSFKVTLDLRSGSITLTKGNSTVISFYEEGMKTGHMAIKGLIHDALEDIITQGSSDRYGAESLTASKTGRYGLAVKDKPESVVWFSSRAVAEEALDAHNKLSKDLLVSPVPHIYPSYLRTLELVREVTKETIVVEVVKD